MISFIVLPVLVLLMQQAVPPGPPPEMAVASALEDLRKAELMLDASAMDPVVAASFVLIEDETRLQGSFAYLEPIRRLRERGGEVRELSFQAIEIKVLGSGAVASYRYSKMWRGDGAHHRESGWCTDVFFLRDGTWVLATRHRAADRHPH